MSPIQKVALAGANGLIGTPILSALLAANLTVTVLTRHDTTSPSTSFPPSVTVLPVDYTSHAHLVSSLRGHDAVVSALTHTVLTTAERALIDAAAEAGVKRFIPSEFGSDSTNPVTSTFPLYAAKVGNRKYLEEVAGRNDGFSWTSIVTGPLLGWVASQAFLQPGEKKAQLYDGGDRLFSVVTPETVGRAVVAVLAHLEETKNRVVKVHDAAVTLKSLLSVAKKVVGEDGWTVTTPDVEEALANSWTGVKAGKFDFPVILGFIVAVSQGEGYGGLLEGRDNELLGIREKTDEEVEAFVEKVVKSGDPSTW